MQSISLTIQTMKVRFLSKIIIILACQAFMGGILKKGLYSANVAYWDNMRSMATDFNNSVRDKTSIDNILNSSRFVDSETLKDVYFAESYKQLLI